LDRRLGCSRLVKDGGSDTLPDGVTFAVADTVAGTGNPVLQTALDAVPDEIFDYILQPYTDATNMTALDTWLAGRQDGNNQYEGHAFNALVESAANLLAYGDNRNSAFATTMSGAEDSLSPSHAWAGAYCGAATVIAQNDPVLPWHSQQILGIDGGTRTNQFTDAERENFLKGGIATHRRTQDGRIFIERGITNYQTNNLGQPDVSYLDSQTPLTLSFARKAYRQRLTQVFFTTPFKLVKDGSRISGQANVATPSSVKGECIALARELEALGIFENVDEFQQLIEAEIAPNVNAVSVKLPPDLVNQLRQILGLIEFRLN